MARMELVVLTVLAAVSRPEQVSPKYEMPLEAIALERYGHWCGWERTGIYPAAKPGYCECEDTVQTCVILTPPLDEVDHACAVRDFCTQCIERASNLDFNWCECEKPFVHMLDEAKCRTPECEAYRTRLLAVYKTMPCYCRWLGKTCTRKGVKETVFCSQINSFIGTC